jgi:hypothetical protein
MGQCCAVHSRITHNRGHTVAQPVLINREKKITLYRGQLCVLLTLNYDEP